MAFERILKNPRESVCDPDNCLRSAALAILAKTPDSSNREILEKLLEKSSPSTSMGAFLALNQLYKTPGTVKALWKKLFSGILELLIKRSTSGSIQIRAAALQALAYLADQLTPNMMEQLIRPVIPVLGSEATVAGVDTSKLISERQILGIHEALATVLAAIPNSTLKQSVFKRELASKENERILPVLLSLQISPMPEAVNQLLLLARSTDPQISVESIRALITCGGPNVYLLVISLLQETANSLKKAAILPVVAATDSQEMWPLLCKAAKCNDNNVAVVALKATNSFRGVTNNEKIKLYSETVRSSSPLVITLSAALAWKAGSTKAIAILSQFLSSNSPKHRLAVAEVLSYLSAEAAITLAATHFEAESDSEVLSKIVLSLRDLLPYEGNNERLSFLLIPWLTRLFKSDDVFKRNQAAVLCGYYGKAAQNLILQQLSKETNSQVIASLIAALGKCGCNSIIIYSKFHDHKDPRVRANMLSAMLGCGNEALPYLTSAQDDSSSRVKATSALNLFMLGQTDSLNILSEMLQTPDPVSVLSACYALEKILKTVLPLLSSEHPLTLAISRKAYELQKIQDIGPGLLNTSEAIDVFAEMATANGNKQTLTELLLEKHRVLPKSYLITRLLASMYISIKDYQNAFPLLIDCIKENPSNLADLIDTYRIAEKIGTPQERKELGNQTNKLYQMLLDGCIKICRNVNDSSIAMLIQRLNYQGEPSMNLYNAMIQLKVAENDNDTVMYLMTELILAKPFNLGLLKKLVKIMPDEFIELRVSIDSFIESLNSDF